MDTNTRHRYNTDMNAEHNNFLKSKICGHDDIVRILFCFQEEMMIQKIQSNWRRR